MTNHTKTPRSASASALLLSLAIAPIMLSSCLTKSDRETIDIPPAPVGDVTEPVTTTAPGVETPAPDSEPVTPPYSLEDAVQYVVQDGDTLSKIATEHGVSINDLKVANKLANANMIRSGQTLLLPGTPAETAEVTTLAAPETTTTPESTVVPPTGTDATSALKLPGLTGE